MDLKSVCRPACFVICIFLMAVSAQTAYSAEGFTENHIRSEVWWVAGDAHATSRAQGLDQAVADINSLGLGLDYAIQLGDNVQDQHEYGSVFLASMSRLVAGDWDYVLGNHDFGPDHMPVLPATYWGETLNGIRFIFLSDEVDGRINRDLIMSDEQRAWFFSELETYRHKPIILFTHQPPAEFEDFENIDFRRYRIKAWFHAHQHTWRITNNTEYGFHQLGINAISGYRDPRQSSVLHINGTEHGTEFVLNFRNHRTREWISVGGHHEHVFYVSSGPPDSDCFIATAAYDSPLSDEISSLRDFRDSRLETNRYGREFTGAYYSIGPPAAEAVRNSAALRIMTRLHLAPVVRIAGLMLF